MNRAEFKSIQANAHQNPNSTAAVTALLSAYADSGCATYPIDSRLFLAAFDYQNVALGFVLREYRAGNMHSHTVERITEPNQQGEQMNAKTNWNKIGRAKNLARDLRTIEQMNQDTLIKLAIGFRLKLENVIKNADTIVSEDAQPQPPQWILDLAMVTLCETAAPIGGSLSLGEEHISQSNQPNKGNK